jgi:hypothetical protein
MPALVGVSSTGDVGSFAYTVKVGLSGITGTAAVGTLSSGISRAIVGVSATGAVEPLGAPPISAGLLGLDSATDVGFFNQHTGQLISTVSVGQVGSLTASTIILAGVTSICAAGQLHILGVDGSAGCQLLAPTTAENYVLPWSGAAGTDIPGNPIQAFPTPWYGDTGSPDQVAIDATGRYVLPWIGEVNSGPCDCGSKEK